MQCRISVAYWMQAPKVSTSFRPGIMIDKSASAPQISGSINQGNVRLIEMSGNCRSTAISHARYRDENNRANGKETETDASVNACKPLWRPRKPRSHPVGTARSSTTDWLSLYLQKYAVLPAFWRVGLCPDRFGRSSAIGFNSCNSSCRARGIIIYS